MSRGKFISFEGGEGSGKSTHSGMLVEGLRGLSIDVLATREPGGTPGAEAIRELLVRGDTGRWDGMTEALMHYAARREHLTKAVWPALELGTWVVSDRFADSTLAYQGYGLGLEMAVIENLHEVAVGNFWPDLTLILDIPVDQGLARTGDRKSGEDRYERMGADLHERIRDGFHKIAARHPERCVMIDATGDVNSTQKAVRAAVRGQFDVALP